MEEFTFEVCSSTTKIMPQTLVVPFGAIIFYLLSREIVVIKMIVEVHFQAPSSRHTGFMNLSRSNVFICLCLYVYYANYTHWLLINEKQTASVYQSLHFVPFISNNDNTFIIATRKCLNISHGSERLYIYYWKRCYSYLLVTRFSDL